MTAKRCLDVGLSAIGLILLAPLFLILAICIAVDSRGPVFFRQERAGRFGQVFRILKFRTMVVNAESIGRQITASNDSRVTRMGRVLRKTKLDELPQLLNVLLNDMSLVGPRPEVPRFVRLYTVEQRSILDLMPGITDPASLRFSDEGDILAGAADPEQLYIDTIMPEKIRLQLEYASRANVITDLALIVRTLARVVRS